MTSIEQASKQLDPGRRIVAASDLVAGDALVPATDAEWFIEPRTVTAVHRVPLHQSPYSDVFYGVLIDLDEGTYNYGRPVAPATLLIVRD